MSEDRYKVGGPEDVAAMLNGLDEKTRTRILIEIENENPDLASQIKKLMFVFDDLAEMDDRSMQALLKEVPQDMLALALRKCSEDLMALVLKNMSKTAARLLQEEMKDMPKQKLSDVETAQEEVKKIAKRLEADGRLLVKKI